MAWGNWCIRCFDETGRKIVDTFGYGELIGDNERSIRVLIYKDWVSIEDLVAWIEEPQAYGYHIVVRIEGDSKVGHRGFNIETKEYMDGYILVKATLDKKTRYGFGSIKTSRAGMSKVQYYIPKELHARFTAFIAKTYPSYPYNQKTNSTTYIQNVDSTWTDGITG